MLEIFSGCYRRVVFTIKQWSLSSRYCHELLVAGKMIYVLSLKVHVKHRRKSKRDNGFDNCSQGRRKHYKSDGGHIDKGSGEIENISRGGKTLNEPTKKVCFYTRIFFFFFLYSYKNTTILKLTFY